MREQQSMTRLSLLHIQDRTEAGSIESDSASTTTTPRTILSAHNAASPAATLGLQRGGLSSSSSLGVDTEQRPSTPHRTSRLSRSITPVSQRASEQAIPLACQLNAMTIIYYIHTHNILVILVYILKGARLHASLSLYLIYLTFFLNVCLRCDMLLHTSFSLMRAAAGRFTSGMTFSLRGRSMSTFFLSYLLYVTKDAVY